MTTVPPPIGASPRELRSAAEAIYADRYQQVCEPSRVGEFVAINVTDGSAEIAEFPEDALQRALKRAPDGVFYLIRIGSSSAFRTSYVD